MELNNTRKAVKEILFFNRVPKVGSQTTMELLKSLSIKNNFHYHKDRTQKVETIKLTYNEEVSTGKKGREKDFSLHIMLLLLLMLYLNQAVIISIQHLRLNQSLA